jgi:prepilin-type N-terminal cleavage/methylation domain-containing protein
MIPEGAKFIRRGGKGFTIIELLTVMSIIVILMSVLVPALSRARKTAKDMSQKAQFYDIGKALADYRNDHQDEYPDSNQLDYDSPTRNPYCGAMKLCEAMVGQDGMGYHPESKLRAVPGNDSEGIAMYPFDLCLKADPASYTDVQKRSMRKRIRYLENLNIRAVKLELLYGTPNPAPYGSSGICAVLTDVYNRAEINAACAELAGSKVGMPILYYKADVRKFSLDANDPTTPNPDNIYDYRDNQDLVHLGLPWDTTTIPPMADMTPPPGPTKWFYERITNPAVTSNPTPYNKEDYILISAGFDGIFGTNDDIFNFRR